MGEIIEELKNQRLRMKKIIVKREMHFYYAKKKHQKSEPYQEYKAKTGDMWMYLRDLTILIDEMESVL